MNANVSSPEGLRSLIYNGSVLLGTHDFEMRLMRSGYIFNASSHLLRTSLFGLSVVVSVTFQDEDNSIRRSDATSFADEGFVTGTVVNVSGTSNNDGMSFEIIEIGYDEDNEQHYMRVVPHETSEFIGEVKSIDPDTGEVTYSEVSVTLTVDEELQAGTGGYNGAIPIEFEISDTIKIVPIDLSSLGGDPGAPIVLSGGGIIYDVDTDWIVAYMGFDKWMINI